VTVAYGTTPSSGVQNATFASPDETPRAPSGVPTASTFPLRSILNPESAQMLLERRMSLTQDVDSSYSEYLLLSITAAGAFVS